MDAALHAHLTFHLRGRQAADDVRADRLAPARGPRFSLALRIFPRFATTFRSCSPTRARSTRSPAIIDGVLRDVAGGDDGARISRHVLRLERRIRELVAEGAEARLSELWALAAGQLLTADDALLKDSLDRARAALALDGPRRGLRWRRCPAVCRHLWKAVQESKARRFHQDVDVLIQKLSDILGADVAVSSAGRTAERLQASVGPARRGHVSIFEAMSGMLRKVAPSATLGASQTAPDRGRVDDASRPTLLSKTGDGYSFVFTSASAALDAFWARRVQMDDLIRAIDVARLEIDGLYREAHARRALRKRRPGCRSSRRRIGFPIISSQHRRGPAGRSNTPPIVDGLAAGLPLKVLASTRTTSSTRRRSDRRTSGSACAAVNWPTSPSG